MSPTRDPLVRRLRTYSVKPLLSRRKVRFWLGAIWLVDGFLQANPRFFTAAWWRDSLAQSVMGEPAWASRSILWAVSVIAAHAPLCNGVFVAFQLGIGLALVTGKCERVAIAVSVPYALGVWWVGEGFGGLPSGFAMMATGAPGAALLYPTIGLLAFPSPRRTDGQWTRREWSVGESAQSGVGGAERFESGSTLEMPVSLRLGLAVWVTLWAGQVLLAFTWVMSTSLVLRANLEESSLGNPAWVVALGQPLSLLANHHAVALAAVIGAVQIAVGVGAFWRLRTALAAGVVVAAVFWISFEYFGGIASGGATDPNSGPLLVLLALSMWRRRSISASTTGAAEACAGLGILRDEPQGGWKAPEASPTT